MALATYGPMLSLARGIFKRGFSSAPFAAGDSPVSLPELPYGYSALEPHISGEIMELHHSKHHQTYVNNYNNLMNQAKEAEEKQDSQVMGKLNSGLHFNGGGHLNHSMFWKNLCPAKDAAPLDGPLLEAVQRDFGSLEQLQSKMNADSAAVQGSGWGWLATQSATGKLFVLTTSNQDPLSVVSPDMVPILGIDVWEHAYYLQYKNVRPDYLKAVWNVVNWADVSARYADATK